MMSYQQLSLQPLQIYHLQRITDLSLRRIAQKMGRSHTTISQDIRRNQHPDVESYLPDTAQS
jgi:IS30 family transposase